MKKKPSLLRHRGIRICALPFAALFAVSASAANVSWNGAADAVWSTGENWVGGFLPVATDAAVFDAGSTTNPGTDFSTQSLEITTPEGLITIGGLTNTLTLGAGGIEVNVALQDLQLNALVTLAAGQARNGVDGQALATSAVIHGSAVNLSKIEIADLTFSGPSMFAGATTMGGGQINTTGSLTGTKVEKLASVDFGTINIGAAPIANRGMGEVRMREGSGVVRSANGGGRKVVKISSRSESKTGAKEEVVITDETAEDLRAALALKEGTGPLLGLTGAEGDTQSDTGSGNTDAGDVKVSAANIFAESNQNLGRQYVTTRLVPLVSPPVTGAWTGATDSNWLTGTNWVGGTAPGTGNTATFDAAAGVGGATISLGTGVTVNTVTFDTASAAAYTIGSSGVGAQTLTINDAGAVTMNSTVASNELFNANIVLGTVAATYTFTNNSPTNTLTFAGGISGGTTGAKTLTIAGAGNTVISGAIATGAGSSVALTVSGTATLGGSNTYGGATTINAGGIVNIQNGIALGTTGGTTTVNIGGALQVQGNILTLIEGLTLNGGGISNDGALRNISGVNIYNGALTLASAARIHSDAGRLILDNTTATGGNLLTFGGAGDLSAVGVVSAAGGLTKEGAGTLAVFAANTYTGNSSLNGGTMLLGSAETAGTSGPLGNKAAAAAGTILFGGGALQFSPQNANDYSGRFSTAGGQAIKIDTNSRSVTFATNITGAGTSFTKTGFGTLTLGGAANTYDGGTTISGGTLLATAPGNLPSSGTLTVNGGGTFSVVNGTADTGYVTNKLTLANSATLAFDWAGASADKLTSTTAATTSGIIGINLTPAAPSGTSTLISAASGLSGASYFLANNTNYTAALTPGDTAITVGSFASVAALTNAYWVGNKIAAANTAGVDNAMALSNGTISNWSSAAAYTATGLVPGSTANVFFSVTSGDTPTQQGNIVLGSDMSVNSVTFNDTTPVIINGSNALTLLSTGTGAASAISTNQDSTINAGVILGATQTWTTAATKTLTLGGNIGNVTAGAGLTIAGTGTTQINGTAAYSGSTTVNNGATLTFAAGSRKTYLGAGNTLVVTGVVNVAGDVDVHSLGGSGLNGVINVPATGALTIRSAEGNQDQNAGIGNGGYGMLNITGGAVSVLASGGAPGSMNMENGGSQALLRITSGVLNAGTMMIARNGGGTSELTITGGTYNKPGGSFNLGDRGGFTTVLNVAGGLIDNTNQTLTWGRSGATAGAALIVANFDAGTILTKEFGVSGQAGFQIIANYNGGTIKVSPGVNANFYNGTQGASSSFMSYVNGAFGAFNGGIVMDTNGSSTTLNANLLAPTGNSITTLSLASGGSGYTGAPIVTIADSGTTQSGTTASASNTITMANTTGVFVGQSITGTGIPAGSIVTAVSPNTSISISQNVTAAGSPTLTFKGQGATAYANVSGGAVTGFIVTNPGVGYVGTVTATLGGGFGTGGSGTAATLNAITPVANSSGGLIKNGLGTLTLSGANTFSGAIAVNTGTLAFGQPLGITNTYGSISGSGAISQTGAGTTILSAANTYAGVTTLTAGVLALTNANALPGGIGVTGGTSALTFSGGVLGLGFENYTRNLGVAGDVTAANFTGAGGWAAYGADRTVNIGGASATITWGTANTGFNGQTLILSNATATHTIEVLNPLDLGNTARTVQVDNGAAVIDGKLSGLLSGTSGGITKTGLGMLTLTNASNSYTGATTVNGGILVTNVSGTLPGGSNVTVSGTGANVTSVLDLAGNSTTIGTLTFGGSTATSGALLRTGAGTLTLGGDVTYANGGNPLGATLSGNLSLGAATRTFTINDSATTPYDLTVTAIISGGVGLTKAQPGTLLLSGANSYSGATIVNAGTVQSANEGALSSTPSVTVNNAGSVLAVSYGGASDYTQAQVGTLLAKTTFSATTTAFGFDTANTTSAATYGSVLSMPAGVTKLGSGTLTLSGNNSYTGASTVVAGTLILSGTNSGTGTATISGGVLRANDGVGLNASSVLTINGGVFETGADIVRNGGSASGNMQITGGNSGFSANGGPVNVAFGGLAAPTALTWGTAPFAVGTLILNGPTANNTLDFKNAVNFGGGARTVQVDANIATMSGVISNGGTLTKTGSGTLVLSGANSGYTAGLIGIGGTLAVNSAIGSTSVNLFGGSVKVNAGFGGSLPTTATLFFGENNTNYRGGGSFIYDNVGAVGATSQTLASLGSQNNQPNDNTVQITRTVAQPVTLIFTAVTGNSTENGNVINFVTKDDAGGGVNGTDYKITLGGGLSALVGAGAASYFNITSQNAYFNGSDFAVYDPAGFVRGVKYGVDAFSATSAGGVSFAVSGISNQQITGNITAQPTVNLVGQGGGNGTLKIVGASDLTMAPGATLTCSGGGNTGAGGIIKTGGGTSIISGGAAINLSGTQGDIRVDGATDILNINMPVTFGGATRLLKSGLGTLILSNGTFAMTDGNSRNRLWINGGIIEVGGNASMNDTSSTITLASGTLLKFSSSASSFVGGSIDGTGSLTMSNGGLRLSSTASYTGVTTLDGGILNITSLANGGAGSGIGASSNAAGNLLFGGGTLQHTGSTAAATDRLFTIGTASGNSATLDASGTTFVAAMTFSNLGPIAFGNTNAHTLTLTGTNVAENTFAPAIGDNVGATSVVKNGVNTWTLTGTNSYSGGTTINAGTLNVIGVTPLGATTGTLAVNNANTGAGRSVVLNLSTTAPTTTGSLSGTLATPSSGTNTVTINNGGKLFTVNQTTPGTYAGAINGSGGFTLGGSALTLTGASNYSGATSVNAGTLALTGSGSLGNTAISVSGGATFAARPGSGTVTAGTTGAGTNGASLSLSAGSAFTMADDAIGTFNLQQNSSYASDGLLINVASGSVPTLTFDIGNGTIDLLNVSRGVTTNAVLGQINFAAITGLTSLTPGSYPFITAASGLGASLFTLANSVIVVGSNAYNLSLSNSTTTQEILTITPNGGSGPIQSFVRTTPASPLNARPGAAISMTATLSNVGTGDLDANLSNTGVLGVTALTSSSDPVVNGTPASITGTINTGATAGTQSWQVTNTDALALNTTVSIGGTVSVYDLANAKYTGATLVFGNLHKLASAGSQTVAFGNQTVTSASFQDLLNVSATTGNASVTAAGFTGLAPSTNGIATSNLTFSVSTATAGSLASAPTLTLTSNANGVAGLSNGTATVVGSPSAITITGQVYSGLMIWDGASGGNWNTDANWNDSQSAAVHAPPGLDGGFTGVDTATFGNTSGSVTVNLSGASPSLNAITFNSTGSYTIAGVSAIKLAGTTPSITSTGTQIISAPLTLGNNLGVTVGGGTLTLSGAIGQSGSFSLTKFGAGTLVLGGTNTFTGATTLSAGTLSVGAGENLGNANALIFDGGTLQITGTALTAYAAGLIGSHAVTLTPDKTAGFDIASAAHTFTISQPLTQGIGGLIKAGPGTLDLVGANTYTGDTNVNAGTLAVNGTISGSTVVNSGGTLAGNNSTGAMGNVTVNSGGTFAPGGSTTGALNTGTLTFAAGSIFGFEIDTFTPAIDFVSITGDLNITSGAILNASDLANVVLPEGTVVPAIIDYSGTWNGGTFNGLADDSIFMIGANAYQISYNGLDGVSSEVTLSVVPEPGVAVSLLGGLGLLLGARRRRA